MIYEHVVELPCAVKGFTRIDIDGNYHIYYNSAYINRRTYEHELNHIDNSDWERPTNEELI